MISIVASFILLAIGALLSLHRNKPPIEEEDFPNTDYETAGR